MNAQLHDMHNGQAIPLSDCPVLSVDEFRQAVVSSLHGQAHLSALFCAKIDEKLRLMAVVSDDATSTMKLTSCVVEADYPALTPECPQAHWFEREVFEKWRVKPVGHPWLKPIRFQSPNVGGQSAKIGVAPFLKMQGEDAHEVAVGPVHAGVIEPGHFRFLCHGETVYHLEISLGYQHRGIEKALVGGPDLRTLHYIETAAGDTTVGHTVAYCTAIEALSGVAVSPTALRIRGVAEELERLANHVGDLGALSGDVGFLPTQNYCGRIRGDVLNLTAELCGNRFGRGLIVPGGVRYGIDTVIAEGVLARLDGIASDLESAVTLLFSTPSVLARMEETGIVSESTAREIGLVGLAARASGIERDVRTQFPYGIYRFSSLPVFTNRDGDCLARANMRWLEIKQSIPFIQQQLRTLGSGPISEPCAAIRPHHLAVTLVEGWRGEICHVAITDAQGRFEAYKIVDPSFHNWFGLACALRGQQISDFPLCNKSFNLSYCGHDL
jgi:Ni,Fe-hydrogenase III large subunit